MTPQQQINRYQESLKNLVREIMDDNQGEEMIDLGMKRRLLRQKYKALVRILRSDPFCEHIKIQVDKYAAEIVELTEMINACKKPKI